MVETRTAITGPRLAGVLGWPVAHSLSPLIHGHWFARYGIDGAYVRLPVAPEDLRSVLGNLPKMGFHGINVTIPHKQAVFEIVDEHTHEAARMQAVNTVLIKSDQRLVGLNTDGLGFLAALEQAIAGFDFQAAPAVLLGTGGAARAIASVLVSQGVPCLRLINRTTDKAQALAEIIKIWASIEIEVHDWSQREPALHEAGLLVNCTSLGMHGQPSLDLPLAHLPVTTPVYDIVYNPRLTNLLKTAQARGNPIVDGLGMLLHQAVPGFAHWGGVTPTVDDELRDRVEKALGS